MTGLDLTGRTAIITGGSRGIGLAIAQQLADVGANVVLTARTQDPAAVDLACRQGLDGRARRRCGQHRVHRRHGF
jgi:NAD(P)-dependent dehydrogenase (short-subunit alcohol dehydrogenase family)